MNATSDSVETRIPTLRYLPGLDGLRAISVLAVMAFHHYAVGGHEAGWAPGGYLGVEVFFVVSGYLITSLLLTERRDRGLVSYRRFYLRRARRLLPALYLLLAGVTAFSLLFLPNTLSTLRGDVLAALTYTSNWWQIISDRSYFVDAAGPELLKHLWSLAIEEQYYLLWPVLFTVGLRKLGRRRMLITMLSVAASSALLLALVAQVNIDHAYYGTHTRLSGLLLGSSFAFVFAPYRIRGLPGHGARLVLDAAGALGLLVLLASFGVLRPFIGFTGFTFPVDTTDDLTVFQGGIVLVDLATLVVIAAAVHHASDVGRMLGWRPLQWTGLRSYSLYLWHYPVFCITRPGIDIEHVGWGFLGFEYAGWVVFAFRMLLSFGLAELSYRYVERPIRNGALSRFRERLGAAHGVPRQRLIRRAVVLGGSVSLIIVMLGTGLANAKPQVTKIPGIDNAEDLPDDGGVLDPSALAVLRGTTTTRKGTTTTTQRGGKTPVTKKGATTTTTRPPPPARVLAIGDSVMLGARGALIATIPGIAVDAVVSRQPGHAPDVLNQYKNVLALPGTVIIHLGTNGRLTDGIVDAIMAAAGPERTLYFLTARVPRSWEAETNRSIHNGLQRHANARALEWRDFAGCHDDWFANDGFHLRTPGQQGYAGLVRDGIAGHPPTKCKK